jgi:outer membrane biosynthesis protein TonB
VLEAGFLILLAAVVGLAELRPALIVLVMAVGWLLVALIEYLAWRETVGFPTVQRYATAAPTPATPVQQEAVDDLTPPPPPPPPVTPPPAEEETIVAPPEAEAPAALEPRPRRRWIIFGPRVRREGDREEER